MLVSSALIFSLTTLNAAPEQQTLNRSLRVAEPTANNSENTNTSNIALNRYIGKPDTTDTTKKISLNFTNIATNQLLQLFAQFTNLNFIVSNKVQGNMSIHLKNIPWSQALNAILKSQGLAQRRIGNTIMIAPAADIEEAELNEIRKATALAELQVQGRIKSLESRNKILNLQPLGNKVVGLRYAKAEDIVKMLSKDASLLTARGAIGFDNRSNSVWIRDTPAHIRTVTRLIHRLDYPEKQVAIYARIVSIRRPFERQLGIKWGVSSRTTHLSGTLAGANQALTTPLANVTPFTERLNFNIPAGTLQDSAALPATMGIALGRLVGDFDVDLELSALEEEGKIQLISKPKLVTSNLQPAYIETGQEIPYQEATSSGATSISFKNAALKLEVTPRITADKRVLLELKVSNNRAGTPIATGLATAIPIDTEEEKSTILLDDKQTIVLGGVYKQDKRKIVTRIPFLGRLPLIGYLFKHTLIRDTRDELLIFLTPTIINKPADLNVHEEEE